MSWFKCWFIVVMAMMFGMVFAVCVLGGNNTLIVGGERKVVSYEYTTECRCGGTIEGYQSLVDDYNREECNKCGYHKE